MTHEDLPLATRDQLWVAEPDSTSNDFRIISSSWQEGALKADYASVVSRAWRDAITTDKKHRRDLQHKMWEVQLLEDDDQVHTTHHIRSALNGVTYDVCSC